VAVLLLVLFLAAVALLIALGRAERARRRAAAATVSLVVDSWGVKRTLADGRYEEVSWAELQEVRAITLPRGPWDDRVRLVLDGGGERGCIVPSDVAGEHGLVEALGALAGFDHRALAEALESTRTGSRVLWQRAPSSA